MENRYGFYFGICFRRCDFDPDMMFLCYFSFLFGCAFLPIESLQQTQNTVHWCSTKTITLGLPKLVSVQQYDRENEARLSEIPAVRMIHKDAAVALMMRLNLALGEGFRLTL